MSNELTQQAQLSYPVGGPMEEKKDIEPKEEEKKAPPEQVVRARRAWEEFRKKLETEGKKLTEQEKDAQEKLIKKGKLPPQKDKPQIPPERVREIMEAQNYRVELAKIIDEIEEYRKAGIDISRFIREGKGIVALLTKIPTEEAQRIINAFDSINKPRKPEAPPHIQEVAKNAWKEFVDERLKKGETVSSEEKAVIDEFVKQGMGPIRGGSGEDEDNTSGNESKNQDYSGYDINNPDIAATAGTERAKDWADDFRQKHEREEKEYRDNAEDDAKAEALLRALMKKAGKEEEPRPASSYEEEYIKIQQALEGSLKEEMVDGKIQVAMTDIGKKNTEELRESFISGEIKEYLDTMEAYKTSQRARKNKKSATVQGPELSKDREELLQIADETEFRDKLAKLINKADNYRFRQMMAERGFTAPTSIQEIAYDIIATDVADYGTGGDYALFKRAINHETGKEYMHFQQNNFLEWARNKMWDWDDNNPDSPGDMFKVIGIFGAIRGVSLGEMVLTPGFFRDKDSGEILDDLKKQLIYEAWPYDKFRNYDIQYRQMKGNDEKILEPLGAIYGENVATKPEVLNKLFSLPDLTKGFENAGDRDPKAGEALKMALLTYYYLPDREMLEKIMSKDGKPLAFFSNKEFRDRFFEGRKEVNNYKNLSKEKQAKLDEEIEKDFIKFSRLTKKHFNEKHELIKEGNNPDLFVKSLNLFSGAMQDIDAVKETRERLTTSLMQRFGINYRTARHVEVLAYKMTRWTGVASKNDTSAIGFDAWSKILNTSEYLQNQSLDRRGGAFGNRYSMFQFKRLGVDFFAGVTAIDGKSILEHIQGGQGFHIDFEKQRKNNDEIRFGENTMTQFFGNHINRSFQLFHSFVGSKALKLNEIVHTDSWGTVTTDPEKFDELFKEGFLKPMRYAYATWPGIDFTQMVQVFVEKTENGKKVVVSEEMPLARKLFGKMMFNDARYKINGRWLEFKYSEMLKERGSEEEQIITKKCFNYLKEQEDDDWNKKKGKEGPDEEGMREREEHRKYLSENIEKYREIIKTKQDTGAIEHAFKGAGRAYFWREAAKVRIASEIKEARKRGTLRKRMSFEETENVYMLLEQMDANIEGSEEGFEDVHATKKLWSKEEIDWIRKKTGTGFKTMAAKEIGWSILEGSPEGFFKALAMLFSNTFKSN